MAEMASLWGFVENQDLEQLEQKLMFTTLELETIKTEARDQTIKNKEYMKQLIQLLKFAIQERDEARMQLQKLLNKSPTIENLHNVPVYQLDKHGKTNSSVTESDSLSANYNYQSHGSSPVEPFFDTVTSPEFSNMQLTSNPAAFVQDHAVGPTIDEGSLLIENLAKGRVLPQNGQFLQAVLGSGPLLKTLLLAGPLPRWRNPPQLQPFQIPPVLIKGCESEVLTKQAPRMVNPQSYAQMPCGTGSAPMMSFSHMSPVSRIGNGSSGIGSNGYVPLGKRQRFC